MKKNSSENLGPEEIVGKVGKNGCRKPQAESRGGLSRRSFLGKVGSVATVAMAAGAVALEPLVGGKHSLASASVADYDSGARATASDNYRVSAAAADNINVGVQPDNGDAALYADKSGSYSKALAHDALGKPNLASWNSLVTAMTTGAAADFEAILNGGERKHNNPQAGLALDSEGLDSHAFVVPPAPTFASAETAGEEVEHYWAALLRDVPFTEYATGTHPLVADAVADMNRLSDFRGPFPVTAENLFRGQIVPGDGNTMGPYISQFMVQPTFFGAQPISQRFRTFLPLGHGGTDYMTSVSDYMTVANGGSTDQTLNFDPIDRYLRNGRDLAAWTHVDVLYQGYFTALLVLGSINAPVNPGNPYVNYTKTQGFGTFGGPDFAATLAEVATRALKAVWFHKWVVNLRSRPEEMGAVIHLIQTGQGSTVDARVHSDVLDSAALRRVFTKYGTYLLPQPFPEGSPTHPCYPTGHGTVGGACITALKFFFDGSQKIQPLLQAVGGDVTQPRPNGVALDLYTGSDAADLSVNGELSKLAFNVSLGHGIHAGIHFRSSTVQSILLGEQVALSVLQDKANCYNEKFSVTLTKFDGTTATVSNE